MSSADKSFIKTFTLIWIIIISMCFFFIPRSIAHASPPGKPEEPAKVEQIFCSTIDCKQPWFVEKTTDLQQHERMFLITCKEACLPSLMVEANPKAAYCKCAIALTACPAPVTVK